MPQRIGRNHMGRNSTSRISQLCRRGLNSRAGSINNATHRVTDNLQRTGMVYVSVDETFGSMTCTNLKAESSIEPTHTLTQSQSHRSGCTRAGGRRAICRLTVSKDPLSVTRCEAVALRLGAAFAASLSGSVLVSRIETPVRRQCSVPFLGSG